MSCWEKQSFEEERDNLKSHGRPITENEIAKLHSKAFCDLEPGICDCESMAKIAAQMMFADPELVFAVAHVSEMLTALKANYYAAWHSGQQGVRHKAPAPIAQEAQPPAARVHVRRLRR